ncbi:hypothetical protein NXC12_PD00317 (plasmid) [Rhizobium etli]|uniref:Uncharacterized protein n=1 Tax=Rhizobium etli TaxID=29449 RepID=A0AAN1BLH2_RHIET|nr:hypothetical protein NXC12_PD00317 [Rhizobium etli]
MEAARFPNVRPNMTTNAASSLKKYRRENISWLIHSILNPEADGNCAMSRRKSLDRSTSMHLEVSPTNLSQGEASSVGMLVLFRGQSLEPALRYKIARPDDAIGHNLSLSAQVGGLT